MEVAKLEQMEKLPRAAIVLNLGLVVVYIILWFTALQQDQFWRADFTCFYTGSSIILAGRGEELYNLETQKVFQSVILKDYIQPNSLVLGYISPPHIALALSPLAALPLSTAFLVWTGVQVMFLVWFLRVFAQVTAGWSRMARWMGVSAAVGLPFMMQNFMLGALSLVMLVCLFEFYLLLRDEKDGSAGGWLAVGSLKFQNTLLVAAALLGMRRWKAVLAAVVVYGGLLLITTAVLGWRVWVDYIYTLIFHANLWDEIAVDPKSMYNLKGALTLLMGETQGGLINLISYGALGIGFVTVIGMWRRYWRRHNGVLELLLAFTVLLGLLLSPHMNPQDGLLVVFPVALFYIYLLEQEKPARLLGWLAGLSPAFFLAAEFGVGARLGFRVPFVVFVGLLIWMGVELRRRVKDFA